MFETDQDSESAPLPIVVLAKLTAARFNQDWHYHLANAAGRPRCGASVNLRDWHLREVAALPSGLCARCARLLGHKTKQSVSLRVSDSVDEADADQLALPLG